MTRHPAVGAIRVAVAADARGGRNAYAITDEDGRDLTPVLSQGDLNALALAIFLGLACASADGGGFGFVLLDDPSQSLGAGHKTNLVKVLDRVAATRKVILATMDREFCEGLAGGLTRARAEYRFAPWTTGQGAAARRTEGGPEPES